MREKPQFQAFWRGLGEWPFSPLQGGSRRFEPVIAHCFESPENPCFSGEKRGFSVFLGPLAACRFVRNWPQSTRFARSWCKPWYKLRSGQIVRPGWACSDLFLLRTTQPGGVKGGISAPRPRPVVAGRCRSPSSTGCQNDALRPEKRWLSVEVQLPHGERFEPVSPAQFHSFALPSLRKPNLRVTETSPIHPQFLAKTHDFFPSSTEQRTQDPFATVHRLGMIAKTVRQDHSGKTVLRVNRHGLSRKASVYDCLGGESFWYG